MTDDSIIQTVILFVIADTLIIALVLWIFFMAMRRLVTSSDFPTIARRWPAPVIPDGKKFSRQYMALNQVWYKNSAYMIIAEEGLYISLGFPMSLSIREATCIPWSYLSYQKKGRSFWTDVYEYQILIDPPVTLTLMARVARALPEQIQPTE